MENKKMNLPKEEKIMLLLMIVVAVIAVFSPFSNTILPAAVAMGTAVIAFIHGFKYYGVKNHLVFFVICWVVSNFFEGLSVEMGFPFGNYYYTMPGPRIWDVPIVIMPAYFGLGYFAWVISLVLNRQYEKKLKGVKVFLVPFVAAFIMVMWDVVFDPVAATINGNWIWEDGGTYFNVPISNYLGWYFVVYVFMQIFAIYISKKDDKDREISSYPKAFWNFAACAYMIQGLIYVETALIKQDNLEIYHSLGLISVFTLCFVALITFVSVNDYYKEM